MGYAIQDFGCFDRSVGLATSTFSRHESLGFYVPHPRPFDLVSMKTLISVYAEIYDQHPGYSSELLG